MNPYPAPQSVLILDNCQIHHTDTLQDVLNAAGIYIFIPIVLSYIRSRYNALVPPTIFTRSKPN